MAYVDDVDETFTIMAAEGCEEMSGNGELEESSGSLMETLNDIIELSWLLFDR